MAFRCVPAYFNPCSQTTQICCMQTVCGTGWRSCAVLSQLKCIDGLHAAHRLQSAQFRDLQKSVERHQQMLRKYRQTRLPVDDFRFTGAEVRRGCSNAALADCVDNTELTSYNLVRPQRRRGLETFSLSIIVSPAYQWHWQLKHKCKTNVRKRIRNLNV